MLVAERRARVLEEVRRRGAASVTELAKTLGVSGMTVRRDLEVLARLGEIDKVRGGATTRRQAGDLPAAVPPLLDEKRAIGKLAATLVEPGMSVGISGGSTARMVAESLSGLRDLTVVTNSLQIADDLQRAGDDSYTQTVVLTGGVRTPSDALVGPVAVRSLAHLHCDIVFLGVQGIDLQAGLTTQNLLEAETARALAEAGRRVVVVADHTKWGRVGLSTILDVDGVDVLITDAGLDPGARETLSASVGELWVAGEGDAGETVSDEAEPSS